MPGVGWGWVLKESLAEKVTVEQNMTEVKWQAKCFPFPIP